MEDVTSLAIAISRFKPTSQNEHCIDLSRDNAELGTRVPNCTVDPFCEVQTSLELAHRYYVFLTALWTQKLISPLLGTQTC